MRLRRLNRNDDEGAVAIIVAATSLVLFGVAAFTVDISYDYSTRRQQQSAADSGALAGAQALNTTLFSSQMPDVTDAPTLVENAAMTAVTNNGGDAAQFRCTLTFPSDPADSPACDDPDAYADAAAPPTGVSVTSAKTTSTFFSGALGASALTAAAAATAQVTPLTSSAGPFMICGLNQTSPDEQTSTTTNQSYAAGADLPQILSNANPPVISQQALGLHYLIAGQGVDQCGVPAMATHGSFTGYDQEGPRTLPADIAYTTQATADPLRTIVSNQVGCGPDDTMFDGCTVVVPVCDSATDGGTAGQLHCVAAALFSITPRGNGDFYATLQASSLVSAGSTGTGLPQFGQAKVVQLVQ